MPFIFTGLRLFSNILFLILDVNRSRLKKQMYIFYILVFM